MAKTQGVDKGRKDDDESGEATPLDLAAMLAEFGASGVTVVLYRRPSTMGEEEYLGSFPSDGFDLDSVKDMYGGGKYRFQLREAGSKRFIPNTSRRFTIGGASKYPSETPVAIVGTRTAGDPILDELRRITERLDRVERTPGAPAKDPLEMALSIVKEMRAVGPGGGQTPAQEIASAMREGMGLMREIGVAGAPPEPGPYDKLAESFGPSFAKLVDAIIAERQNPKPIAIAPPRATESADPSAIVPGTPATAHPEVATTVTPGHGLMALQRFIPSLAKWSAADSNPSARAILTLEKLDESTKREIFENLKDPTVADKLIAFLPGNAEQRVWYREFFEEVQEALAEEFGPPDLKVVNGGAAGEGEAEVDDDGPGS